MSNWTIYYNPKCGTCRNTLEILKKNHIKPTIVEYLKNPPSIKDLNAIVKKLRVQPIDIVRAKEPIYEELKLSANTPREELLRAISEHPVLLQRPIVINDYRAVISRPPEEVLKIL